MESALWSKVSEQEKEEIKKQAKEILTNFARALEKVKVQPSTVERKEDRRHESEGAEPDSKFRDIMFKNAPKTKDDCIEAEKGNWT